MLTAIINLQDYTWTEHIFFLVGCIGWVITYAFVIKAIFKSKFVEIPVISICANFAWEFLWSFIFKTDMGELYVWGYRIWFFMDCFIVYGMFKYGYKQMASKALADNFKLLMVFSLACWFVATYYYIKIYDAPITHMGANSGYILNVFMSLLYPLLILRMGNTNGFSEVGAWAKGVGTFLITIFCFLKFTDQWLLSLCVITAILDAGYIYVYYKLKKNPVS